jgi:CRP-like cAMP-binding protein
MGVLYNIPRTASARALEDSSCNVVEREVFIEILSKFPRLAKRFKKTAGERMKEIQAQKKKRVSIILTE